MRFMIIGIFVSITIHARAQMYIGITCDFGNPVTVDPNSDGWIKTPSTFSGSITFYNKEEIRDGWFLQYGASLGDLGYTIKASEADTLSNDPDFYDAYTSYYTLYVNGHFAMGKQFSINKRKVSVFAGGGATHYFDFADIQTNSSSGVWDGNSFETVFDYEMKLESGALKAFADVSVQTNLGSRILIGLQYRHHFKPALTGTYNFYHTKEPASGTLSLTQRAVSILFLYRIGKNIPE